MFLQGAFEATVCPCRSGKAVMKRTVVDELGNHNDVLLDGVSLLFCPLNVPFACAGGDFARMRERPLEELLMLDSSSFPYLPEPPGACLLKRVTPMWRCLDQSAT
jgi:hypothetical protein